MIPILKTLRKTIDKDEQSIVIYHRWDISFLVSSPKKIPQYLPDATFLNITRVKDKA